MTHDYFKDYRGAYDALQEARGGTTYEGLMNTLRITQEAIEEIESPYQELIRSAEEGIHAITLDQQRTVILHGIEAKYTKPRKSTKWKAIALTFEPMPELIEEYSTVGSPSVSITVHEVLDLED